MDYNLLSVSRLIDAGYNVSFEKGEISYRGRVVAVAQRNGQLYVLHFTNKNSEEAASLSASSGSPELWHRRLGYLSLYTKVLRNLVDDFDCGSLEECNSEICETCLEGKQTYLPHSSHRVRATRPLELIHTDLVGFINPCLLYTSPSPRD